jgi:CRISPR-associated protein Csx17
MDELLEVLCEVAAKRAWNPYERGWGDAQKESTKRKSGRPLAVWQASAEECDLELVSAHVVPAAKVSFNPLLGSGGNAGKRDFSDGWARATQALESGQRTKKGSPDAARKRVELKSLLLGDPLTWMVEKLNAASWFSDTNKLYNSGQRPFREGVASPWAMALACEGLAFLAGGASRRLGSRARSVGAFPFVTRAAAPREAGEAGRDLAEVWVPLWDRPMTVREVVALFSRGRAEAGGRGVLTPAAFATAVMRRGLDAGITEFRRFVLSRTTSANTFEPRFEGRFEVRISTQRPSSELVSSRTAAATALQRMLDLADGLPADRKVGQRWRYVGLRGDIEAAMLGVAAEPSSPEAACEMLDAVVAALDRIDRNRTLRERRIAWEPLPLEWLPTLFGSGVPGTEVRLALALVSSFPADRPLAIYRFGVEQDRGRRFAHPPEIPKQWVWRSHAPLPKILSDTLHRRTLDWEAARDDVDPLRLLLPATSAHVNRWLAGLSDDELLARWISRLALFNWRVVPSRVRLLATRSLEQPGASGPLCLFGLFQPLFDLCPVLRLREPGRDLLPRESGARTPAAARSLSGSLRLRDIEGAVRFASGRYRMANAPLVRSEVPWGAADADRLTASLLFPIFDYERSALTERWLRPRRNKGELAHA